MVREALISQLMKIGLPFHRANEIARDIAADLPGGWSPDEFADFVLRYKQISMKELALDPNFEQLCEELREGQGYIDFARRVASR